MSLGLIKLSERMPQQGDEKPDQAGATYRGIDHAHRLTIVT